MNGVIPPLLFILPAWGLACAAVAAGASVDQADLATELVIDADALGTGHALYAGSVPLHADVKGGRYLLRDLTRGGHEAVTMDNGTTTEKKLKDDDNVWGNGSKRQRQTVAADAAYGQNAAWDYFKTVHGRTGVLGNGKGGRSRVHYGVGYDNAFWGGACFCVTYGDGQRFNPLVSLDMAGHEWTHGVIQSTAHLVDSGESGGLSEGTADIFGAMIEFHAANAEEPGNYLIGEAFSRKAGQFLRSLIQPSQDGFSSDCWYSGVGNLDGHYAAGVANHAFFLLAEGTTQGVPSRTCVSGDTRVASGNGTLSGIGRAKAEKIWYRALTVYMTASETFAKARLDTVQAAMDLYGTSSAEAAAVAAAWSAVNRP